MGQVIYQRAKELFDFNRALRIWGEQNILANDSFLTVPANASTSLTSGSWTISMWVRIQRRQQDSALPNRRFYPLLRWGASGTGAANSATLLLDFEEDANTATPATAQPGKYRLSFNTSGGLRTDRSLTLTAAAAGEWHHIAIRRDTSVNTLMMLINGVENIFQGSVSGDLLSYGTDNYIGRGFYTSSTLDGYLDEVCLYGAALNNGEIAALYNSGAGSYPNTARWGVLRARWVFDEESGTSFSDSAALFNPGAAAGSGTLVNYNAERTLSTGRTWVDHFTLLSQDFYSNEYSDTSSAYVDGINDTASLAAGLSGIRTLEIEAMPTKSLPQFFTENANSWSGAEFHRHLVGDDGFPVPASTTAAYLSVGTNGVIVQAHRTNVSMNCRISHAVAIPSNSFTHVALVFSADHRVSLYVNGVFVRQSGAEAVPWGINILRIGVMLAWNSFQWQGRWKNLRVWDYERSAAQINANKTAVLGAEAGLLLNITGQRSSATQNTFNDASGNNRHLTLNNYILQP